MKKTSHTFLKSFLFVAVSGLAFMVSMPIAWAGPLHDAATPGLSNSSLKEPTSTAKAIVEACRFSGQHKRATLKSSNFLFTFGSPFSVYGVDTIVVSMLGGAREVFFIAGVFYGNPGFWKIMAVGIG